MASDVTSSAVGQAMWHLKGSTRAEEHLRALAWASRRPVWRGSERVGADGKWLGGKWQSGRRNRMRALIRGCCSEKPGEEGMSDD